jgi:hypothetical protein
MSNGHAYLDNALALEGLALAPHGRATVTAMLGQKELQDNY